MLLLGRVRFDLETRRLYDRDGDIFLRPQSLEVLLSLARHRGEVVEKEALIGEAWGHLHVTDDSLTQCISDIRKSIRDKRRHIIRTVPRRGYMLNATELTEDADRPPPRRPALLAVASVALLASFGLGGLKLADTLSHARPADAPPSLAVMPFRNPGADPREAYFVEGITEDLILDLSRLRNLEVTSRNTAFAYSKRNLSDRELAAALGVRYLMQGSVRRQDDILRVNVEMVDTVENRYVWAEQFEEAAGDIFSVQDRVKARIVSALSVHLSEDEADRLPTATPQHLEAYDLFLRARKARHQGTQRALRLTYWSLERALELEPDFAAAMIALAETNAFDFSGGNHPLEWERPPMLTRVAAERLASRARELAPGQAGPDIALARLRLGELRWETALDHARAAVRLEPQLSDAHVMLARTLSAAGFHSEALEEIRLADALDPVGSPEHHTVRGMALFGLRRMEEALESLADANAAAEISLDWRATSLAVALSGLLGRSPEAFDRGTQVFPSLSARMPVPLFAHAADQALLSDGLTRAGIVPHSGAQLVRGAALPGNEVRELILGTRSTGFCYATEYLPKMRVSSEGSVLWSLRDDINIVGTATVRGGRLCIAFENLPQLREGCFEIRHNAPSAPDKRAFPYVMQGAMTCFFDPSPD